MWCHMAGSVPGMTSAANNDMLHVLHWGLPWAMVQLVVHTQLCLHMCLLAWCSLQN